MFDIVVPSQSTLDKYGLSMAEWEAMVKACKGICAICDRHPPSHRFVIDHDHVVGWAKMPPGLRKLYVRGLLCSWCNFRMIPRTATPAKLRAAARYLERYLRRKP